MVSGRYPENPTIWLVPGAGSISYLLLSLTVMVTNYAERRVKLRIERAKFQSVLIVFCNRAVLLFNFLIKKKQWILTKAITVKANFITQTKKKNERTNEEIVCPTFYKYNLEINKNVIHRPWSVRIGKTVPSVSSTALGLRPRAVLETWGTVFPDTDFPAGE